MVKVHHLQSKLKSLRLGGMMDTIEQRLEQAQEGKLGYLEFLELMLEDEIGRRAQRGLASRIAKAHFEENKTLEEFDFGFNPKIPVQKIKELASCRFMEAGESVIVCGPVGTGKSHLIQALGHSACRTGYNVQYITASRMLSDLGGGRADGSWPVRFRHYLHPDLLIVDDFCLKELSSQQAEDIYELIGERHRNMPMMIASNRSPKDWYPLFPNPVLAEGALDRLINRSHHLVLEGRSYRPLLRPDARKAVAREGESE
jgi:DNA replication protein DnaC